MNEYTRDSGNTEEEGWVNFLEQSILPALRCEPGSSWNYTSVILEEPLLNYTASSACPTDSFFSIATVLFSL